jgi:hypothetical protein
MARVWLVTGQAREETKDGVIQRVVVRAWGVYSSEDRAAAMATKYNGSVTELVVDEEQGANLQQWLNPGYYAQG